MYKPACGTSTLVTREDTIDCSSCVQHECFFFFFLCFFALFFVYLGTIYIINNK